RRVVRRVTDHVARPLGHRRRCRRAGAVHTATDDPLPPPMIRFASRWSALRRAAERPGEATSPMGLAADIADGGWRPTSPMGLAPGRYRPWAGPGDIAQERVVPPGRQAPARAGRVWRYGRRARLRGRPRWRWR